MFHKKKVVMDSKGNLIEKHYQLDLKGNWVEVCIIKQTGNDELIERYRYFENILNDIRRVKQS